MSATYEIDASNASERGVFLREFSNLRGPVKITVAKKLKLRSSAANRYYWSVLIGAFRNFLREQGQVYSANLCHEMLKKKFLSEPVFNKFTGEVMGEYTKSTTELNTAEFREYCENVEAFLTGLGSRVPSANEYIGQEASCDN